MATAIMQIAKRVRKMQMRAVLMVACVMVGGFEGRMLSGFGRKGQSRRMKGITYGR